MAKGGHLKGRYHKGEIQSFKNTMYRVTQTQRRAWKIKQGEEVT